MQNNLIACTIVVLLCTASSIVIGAISILSGVVPAAMVNAFLYLTAGVFVIFANCIQHIKVSRVHSKWGPCYPIASLPDELYHPKYIRINYGWPVYVSWASVSIFLAASCVWFVMKRLLNFETSKGLI